MKVIRFSRGHAVSVIVLTMVCCSVFFNSLPNAFVWDDITGITENPDIRDYRHIPGFFTPRFWNEIHPFPGQFRPLRTVTLVADYALWKLNPTGYRVTNVLLHALNVVLVYFLVSGISRRNPEPHHDRRVTVFLTPAFLTAVLFAVHPIHTESVNLVKNRSDLLAFVFFLFSFLLFVKHFTAHGRKSRLMLIGAWVLFIPALLSKEMALSLPGVLAFYTICFTAGHDRKKGMIRLIPFGAIIGVYLWFMKTFIAPVDALPAGVLLPSGPVQHVLTAVKTAGLYLKMLLVPFPLNADHAFTIPGSVFEPVTLLSLAAVLPVLVGIAVAYRYSRVVCFALGWLLLTLTPAINIMYLVSRPIAEQRLYIPSLGFCLLLGYGIGRFSQVRSLRQGRVTAMSVSLAAAVMVAAYSFLTIDRNLDWRDEKTFYTRTLAANPDSARMHNNLGIVLNKAGRYEDAIGHYLTALRLDPHYIKPRLNLGVALCNTGRYEEAVTHFQAGLLSIRNKHDGRYAGIYNNLGVALMRLGELDKSEALFRKVIKMDPDNISAVYNLGGVLMAQKDFSGALILFSRVLRLNPDHKPARRAYEQCRPMSEAASGKPGKQ